MISSFLSNSSWLHVCEILCELIRTNLEALPKLKKRLSELRNESSEMVWLWNEKKLSFLCCAAWLAFFQRQNTASDSVRNEIWRHFEVLEMALV